MKTLVIIAHGSRNTASNSEIEDLVTRLKLSGSDFDLVEHAFLELAQPDIGTTLDRVIAAGAREIFVFPYFLAKGNHVERDIPDEMQRLIKQSPSIRFHMLTHFGANANIISQINAHIQSELGE